MVVTRWYIVATEVLTEDGHSADHTFLQGLNAGCEVVSIIKLNDADLLMVFRGEVGRFTELRDSNITRVREVFR